MRTFGHEGQLHLETSIVPIDCWAQEHLLPTSGPCSTRNSAFHRSQRPSIACQIMPRLHHVSMCSETRTDDPSDQMFLRRTPRSPLTKLEPYTTAEILHLLEPFDPLPVPTHLFPTVIRLSTMGNAPSAHKALFQIVRPPPANAKPGVDKEGSVTFEVRCYIQVCRPLSTPTSLCLRGY